MEKEQLKARIKELMESEDFLKSLYKETDNVIDSGMVNIEGAREDYGLAKVVLYCGLRRLVERYRPPNGTSVERENRDVLRFYKTYH